MLAADSRLRGCYACHCAHTSSGLSTRQVPCWSTLLGFSVIPVTIVLNGDTMAGVSIHVKMDHRIDLRHSVPGSLLKAKL